MTKASHQRDRRQSQVAQTYRLVHTRSAPNWRITGRPRRWSSNSDATRCCSCPDHRTARRAAPRTTDAATTPISKSAMGAAVADGETTQIATRAATPVMTSIGSVADGRRARRSSTGGAATRRREKATAAIPTEYSTARITRTAAQRPIVPLWPDATRATTRASTSAGVICRRLRTAAFPHGAEAVEAPARMGGPDWAVDSKWPGAVTGVA